MLLPEPSEFPPDQADADDNAQDGDEFAQQVGVDRMHDARAEQYAVLQKKVTDEGPYIFMFQNNIQVARRATTTGYTPGLSGDLSYFRKIRKS